MSTSRAKYPQLILITSVYDTSLKRHASYHERNEQVVLRRDCWARREKGLIRREVGMDDEG